MSNIPQLGLHLNRRSKKDVQTLVFSATINDQLKVFYDENVDMLDNAIEVLEMDENAVDCLLDCEILLELYQKMDIPQFDLESLTLIEKTSKMYIVYLYTYREPQVEHHSDFST